MKFSFTGYNVVESYITSSSKLSSGARKGGMVSSQDKSKN